MRWQNEKPLLEDDFGRRRVVERFLWFPLKLNYETRWLEKVMIEQRVTFRMVDNPDSVYFDHKLPFIKQHYWQDFKWIDHQ